jgi:predicted branched-subunit amino acid permease
MTSAAYSSPGAAFVGAAVEYARLPAVAMAAAFVGFGAIVHDSGFDVVQAMVTTAGMTQIPAQIVLVETARAGAGLAGVFLAVAFIGARILPMVLSLMPLLTPGARGRLELYAATHLVATMSWTSCMRRCPDLPFDQRMPYFWGVALANLGVVVLGTVVGHTLAGAVAPEILIGLVFLTPVFFLLLFAAESPDLAGVVSLMLGAVLGPAIHLLSPEWSVFAGGLAGGTIAFALVRKRR